MRRLVKNLRVLVLAAAASAFVFASPALAGPAGFLGVIADLNGDGTLDEDELEVARTCAPIVSVQDRFDVLTREREAVLDACARNGIVFLPWFPPSTAENAPAGSALQRISTRRDVPASQVALAWLMAQPTVAAPITSASIWWNWR